MPRQVILLIAGLLALVACGGGGAASGDIASGQKLFSGATPIDFTGDIKEIDGRPIAKRGRIPGVTESPRLRPVDLTAWRSG